MNASRRFAVLLFIPLAIAVFARVEGSRAAMTFVVTTTADTVDANDNALSLREAITSANAAPGADTISFNIPTAQARMDGVFTINVGATGLGMLPPITDPVVLDGYTQPGAQRNIYNIAAGSNARLLIELNGASTPSNGLYITAGASTVRGLIINRFIGAGIALRDGGGNIVEGNFIGTDASGETALGNGVGISIISSLFNRIGGVDSAARNVISGNSFSGVLASGDINRIEGNLIGTNITGDAAVANGVGIFLQSGSSGNHIGGADDQMRNVISGNNTYGVKIEGDSNRVQSNFIGTAAIGIADPASALGNGTGVFINGSQNIVGASPASTEGVTDGNHIAFNTGAGIVIANGSGNRISENSILSNAKLGIDLEDDDAVNPNDAGDDDGEANNGQNFPHIYSVTTHRGMVTITGALDDPHGNYTVEFFSTPACDSSGYGEGVAFLGSVTTEGQNGVFSYRTSLPPGQNFVAATATNEATGETSEFSRCVAAPPETRAPIVMAVARTRYGYEEPTLPGSVIEFEVDFSRLVSGVDPTDFVLTTTGGISGASIISITSDYDPLIRDSRIQAHPLSRRALRAKACLINSL